MDFTPYVTFNRDIPLRLIAVVFNSIGLREGD